jgi:hypothetical protein
VGVPSCPPYDAIIRLWVVGIAAGQRQPVRNSISLFRFVHLLGIFGLIKGSFNFGSVVSKIRSD